jgi:hypothetical protein
MNATVGRVRRLTPESLNEKFRAQAEARIAYYANHPEEIDQRLRELDEEWDIERAIETEAAATVLGGLFLGAAVSRKWYVLPAFAAGMLLLHNVHGAYPLLPLFRRFGLRTSNEIAAERYGLKAIRGDFSEVTGSAENKRDSGRVFEAADATA